MMTQNRDQTSSATDLKQAAAVVGPPLRHLTRQRGDLLSVQTAMLMVHDGISRATASEIAERLEGEYGVAISASVVGTHLSRLKIPTRTTHGRARYVLERDMLLPLQARLAEDIERSAPIVDEVIEQFAARAEQVMDLEDRLSRILRQSQRESEIREFIDSNRIKIEQLERIESHYRRVRAQVQRIDQLKAAIANLQGKVTDLQDVEERRAALQQEIDDHRAEEEALARREMAVKDRLSAYPQRTRRVQIAELDQAIKEREAEIAQLDQQLGEKRSRLGRLLGGGR